jgi:hypothetical protein
MAKIIEPKLSEPKDQVISKALTVAACNAAESVLGRLYLSTRPLRGETAESWKARAADAARELSDYCALRGDDPEEVLRHMARFKDHLDIFVDRAVALVGEVQSELAGRAAA